MSLITETADLATAVADQCDTLGLVDLAKRLRSPSSDNASLLRPMLGAAISAAVSIHTAASHAHAAAPGMLVVDTILGRLTDNARALEKAALAALVSCDRLLEEQHAARESKVSERPVLNNARRMNLHRGHDQ
jgi:ActR/RegA family two-component response regulator